MRGPLIDGAKLRADLLVRGLKLNPPALDETLQKLSNWAGGPIHPDILEVFANFDGFADMDMENASLVSVWPIEQALGDDFTQHPILAFSDQLVEVFVYGIDPAAGGPVRVLPDGGIIAETFAEFWSHLLNDPGHFSKPA